MAENTKTLMGWNQVVWVTEGSTDYAIKVSNITIGIKQSFEVPQLVTGLTDAITWQKGTLEVDGNISAPMTQSLATRILKNGFMDTEGNLQDIYISSTVTDSITAKINTIRMEAQAGSAITVNTGLFGVLSGDVEEDYQSTWGEPSNEENFQYLKTLFPDTANASGMNNLYLEQVPMFDRVTGAENFAPVDALGQKVGEVTQISLSIENNLKRNYVLGQGTLNAYSVSAGQRKLSGSITFISDNQANIGFITMAGLSKQTSFGTLRFGPVGISLEDNARLVFGAEPPTLSPGDVVSITSNFQIVVTNAGIIPITVS